MARGSDSDWNQCYVWNKEAKDKLLTVQKMLADSDASTEVCIQMNELAKDITALIDGVFGTAMRARDYFQREAEKLHAAREAWEDAHGGA